MVTVEHLIGLRPDFRPAIQHLYGAGLKTREHEGEETDLMITWRVIKPTMERTSSVALVPKNEGKRRFCVHYRELDTMTVGNTYHLPQMNEHIDVLGMKPFSLHWTAAVGTGGLRSRCGTEQSYYLQPPDLSGCSSS